MSPAEPNNAERVELLRAEAAAFDQQIDERLAHGYVPDLRRLARVEWFRNNVWREPELVEIQLMPKVRFVLAGLPPAPSRVVELGCGCGYLSLELARNGYHVLGVDVSSRSIEVARQFAEENPFKAGFGSLEYVVGDLERYPLGEVAWDAVVFFGTLHHVAPLGPLIDRVHAALRPGGRLLVAEPVRAAFAQQSAEFAALMRAVLPTWESSEQKLAGLSTSQAWHAYIDAVREEYTYSGAHVQSPCDNSTASEAVMLEAIERRFTVQAIQRSDAFLDRLIGGLRGPDRHSLARFLKMLDDDLIARGVLPATHVVIRAVKQ